VQTVPPQGKNRYSRWYARNCGLKGNLFVHIHKSDYTILFARVVKKTHLFNSFVFKYVVLCAFVLTIENSGLTILCIGTQLLGDFMVELLTYAYLDRLQPQFTAFVSTIAKGYLPLSGQASLWVEIRPGMDINRLTDAALKSNEVQPGIMVVERAAGVLELHGHDQGAVREAGNAILASLGMKMEDRLQPRLVGLETIKNITDFQCQLINRMRHGNMILPGETLLTVETHPASYAALVANEIEKAARINIIEVNAIGAFGRVYVGGPEAEVMEAKQAAERIIASISGRPNKV